MKHMGSISTSLFCDRRQKSWRTPSWMHADNKTKPRFVARIPRSHVTADNGNMPQSPGLACMPEKPSASACPSSCGSRHRASHKDAGARRGDPIPRESSGMTGMRLTISPIEPVSLLGAPISAVNGPQTGERA